MTSRRRVWITGIGVITAIGTGRDAFRAGLRAGRSPVKRIDRFDPSPFRRRSRPRSTTSTRSPGCRRRPPASSTGSASSGSSPAGSRSRTPGLTPGRATARRIRSGSGSTSARARRHRLRRGPARALPRARASGQVAPNLALAVFGGAAPANLGIALDVRGPILSTANSCASGAVALGEALGRPARGPGRRRDRRWRRDPAEPARVRCVRHHPGAVGRAQRRRRATAARPFDRGRDGFVMGEGAALLVLEAAESRARRGAHAVRGAARLRRDVGRASTWSSRGPTAREAARAATIALADAGVTRRRSTTSTPTRRRRRSATSPRRGRSRLALGERAATVPVSGTKALYGHPLGASGAIEAAICALAIRDGWAPASVNLVEPDPDVGALLPGLLREGRDGTYRRVLSTSFGFGGLNAALVFGRRRGLRRPRRPVSAVERSRSASRVADGGAGHRHRGRRFDPRRRRRSRPAATGRRRGRSPPRCRTPRRWRPSQAADRGRAAEDRRVDAHHPAAQAVRAPRAGSWRWPVAAIRIAAEPDRDHEQRATTGNDVASRRARPRRRRG